MRSLRRKILFNTETEISEHYRELIARSLGNTKYDLHFLEESKNWKLSDIENKGSYEILDLAEFGEIRLDTIHVGVVQFSDIGFSENRDTAILYYDWMCGSLCGGGNVIILQKSGDTWKIIESINLRVS